MKVRARRFSGSGELAISNTEHTHQWTHSNSEKEEERSRFRHTRHTITLKSIILFAKKTHEIHLHSIIINRFWHFSLMDKFSNIDLFQQASERKISNKLNTKFLSKLKHIHWTQAIVFPRNDFLHYILFSKYVFKNIKNPSQKCKWKKNHNTFIFYLSFSILYIYVSICRL